MDKKIKEYLQKQAERNKKRVEEIRACLEEDAKRVEAIGAESKQENKTEEDLKRFEAELDEIKERKAKYEAEKANVEADLAEVEAQIKAIDEDEGKRHQELPPQNQERRNFLVFENETRKGEKHMNMTIEERMARAKELKETNKRSISVEEYRSILISGGKIATPTGVEGIEDNFNRVCSIVDLVKVVDCVGMGSNKVAYEKSISTADVYTEGQDLPDSDPDYGYVTITPKDVGVYSTISNKVMKQSPLNYEGKVTDSAYKALRVKAGALITKAILDSDLVTGNEANLAINAIDDKTLRKIALAYGSPESVYGNAYLFLSKADLIAFGDVRGTNGNKSAVYEITPDTNNPNTGVIKDGGLSVRYCLNPNLKPLGGQTTEADDIVMFYGQPQCAELDLFGNYEIEVSRDSEFKKDMLAIRGTVELGADVVKKDGFVAVKKAGA